MYQYNGKKVSIDDMIEVAGAFYAVRNPGDRAAIGVIEVDDPVYPDPDIFDWDENEDGSLNIRPKDPERVAEIKLRKARQDRANAVAVLTVTTQAGNTYDADLDSQRTMGTYLSALDDGDVIPWVLADNTVVQINKAELKEALRRAGAALAPLWVKPYED